MVAYASTLPIAARSTGTSFSVTFVVTTGAAPPSPPRPRPPRPPPPGPAAAVLLSHADTARPVSARSAGARIGRDRLQARLSTLDSKVQKDTGLCCEPFTRRVSFDVSLGKNNGFLTRWKRKTGGWGVGQVG